MASNNNFRAHFDTIFKSFFESIVWFSFIYIYRSKAIVWNVFKSYKQKFLIFCYVLIVIHHNPRILELVFLIQIWSAQNLQLTAFEFFLFTIIIITSILPKKSILTTLNPKPITGVNFTSINVREDHKMTSWEREVYGRSKTVSNQSCFLVIVLHPCFCILFLCFPVSYSCIFIFIRSIILFYFFSSIFRSCYVFVSN